MHGRRAAEALHGCVATSSSNRLHQITVGRRGQQIRMIQGRRLEAFALRTVATRAVAGKEFLASRSAAGRYPTALSVTILWRRHAALLPQMRNNRVHFR